MDKKEDFECVKCNHRWFSIVETPKYCPRCKNPRYINKIKSQDNPIINKDNIENTQEVDF